MARAVEDLGRQVLGCAAEGLRALVRLADALLRQSEVGETHVTLFGQQHVFGLEVAASEREGV